MCGKSVFFRQSYRHAKKSIGRSQETLRDGPTAEAMTGNDETCWTGKKKCARIVVCSTQHAGGTTKIHLLAEDARSPHIQNIESTNILLMDSPTVSRSPMLALTTIDFYEL